MTSIYNPQQIESDENTYVTALAFATGTGVLTATRNDGVEITQSLDGRYSQTDIYLDSASFDVGDGVLTLTRTDAGTVTVDLDGRYVQTADDIYLSGVAWDQNSGDITFSRNNSTNIVENIDGRYVPFKYTVGVVTDLDDLVTTQVQVCDKSATNRPTASSSSMDVFTILVIKGGAGGSQLCMAGDADSTDNQIWIRMWKDNAGSYTWTDWTELPTSTTGNFVPFDLTIPSPSYNLNDYTTTGIFSVDKNATNIPSDMPSWVDKLVLHVTNSGSYNGNQTLYTANGTATSEFGRIYYRKWEDAAGINWSNWTEINVGGISGDLKTSYAAIDLDSSTYRETGYWALGAKGAATTWPSALPATSDFNILQTIRSGSSGAGQQKIMCADYDSGTPPDTHIREWKRVFDNSNETDWYEYQFQGQPIYKQVYHTTEYDSSAHGNNPDSSNTAAYYVTVGGDSLYLYGFQNGYAEGQTMRIFRETNDMYVTVVIYNNIYYAVQPIFLMNGGTSLTLSNYQSAEFIYHNNIWFQYK